MGHTDWPANSIIAKLRVELRLFSFYIRKGGKGTIHSAFTKPLRLRNVNKSEKLLQLIFCCQCHSFQKNNHESNRFWICKFRSKSKWWALGIPRIQVSVDIFAEFYFNFILILFLNFPATLDKDLVGLQFQTTQLLLVVV